MQTLGHAVLTPTQSTLERPGLSGKTDDSNLGPLESRIYSVVRDQYLYKQLLTCQGSDAQRILDTLQTLLDKPDLSGQLRPHLFVAAERLTKRSKVYPVCYELNNITWDQTKILAKGGFADIYKGNFEGQDVSLKTIRIEQSKDIEYFLKPNIVIDNAGRARLMDFGFSRVSHPDIVAWSSRKHSAEMAQGGTYRYQAPELNDIYSGVVLNTEASDVYAWSMVCLEASRLLRMSFLMLISLKIFTGAQPFANIRNDIAVPFKVIGGDRPECPPRSSPAWIAWGLTESMWSLMRDSWKQAPADRPSINIILTRLKSEFGLNVPVNSDSRFLSPAEFRRRAGSSEVMTLSDFEEIMGRLAPVVRDSPRNVVDETGKANDDFNIVRQTLFFPLPGEEVELCLKDRGRQFIGKYTFKTREGDDVLVYLLDHAILFTIPMETGQFKVYQRPIPLHLLCFRQEDSKSEDSIRPIGDNGHMKRIDFEHIGFKCYYKLVLYAPAQILQKCSDMIVKQRAVFHERTLIFHAVPLKGEYAANKVNSAAWVIWLLGESVQAKTDRDTDGKKVLYSTNEGVYGFGTRDIGKHAGKVLAMRDVLQLEVVEESNLLIVLCAVSLADSQVFVVPLNSLDAKNPAGSAQRAKQISSYNASFFKTFSISSKTILLCIVKSSEYSSAFKIFEHVIQKAGHASRHTLVQEGNNAFRPKFKEFQVQGAISSIHYSNDRLYAISSKSGFEIVNLESPETRRHLDLSDEGLGLVAKENLRPMAMYGSQNESKILLCYEKFAFYVDANGRRARNDFLIHWKGKPTAFGKVLHFVTTYLGHISNVALDGPYVLAIEPSFVEVRHTETGVLKQIIQRTNLELHTPALVTNNVNFVQPDSSHIGNHRQSYTNASVQFGSNGNSDTSRHSPLTRNSSQGIVLKREILLKSDDGVFALRANTDSNGNV
ncbi:hypothetical protein C0991_002089 [Blastosporella zonata]|nr:hypothetical protein C0991_002089 [Blastosporella zonata]